MTHASVDGDTLKAVVTYTAKGANADDARRRIMGASKSVWRWIEDKPKIVRTPRIVQ